MKKYAPLLLALILLCACGRRAEDTPSQPTLTTATAANTAATVPAQAIQIGPIDALTIASAREWNAFAGDFNENREAFSDELDITIAGVLDFMGLDFVPLGTGFSGCMVGTEWNSGFYNIDQVAACVLPNTWVHYAESPALPPEADYCDPALLAESGLRIMHPNGLFGGWCDSLRLEGLRFENITACTLSTLFADSVGTLEVSGVSIERCHLTQGRTFLALNAGELTVDGLDIYRSGLYGSTWMAGLARWVHGDVTARKVRMSYVQACLLPDLGGSGIGVGGVCLGVGNIGGVAVFRDWQLAQCTLQGVWSYLLTQSGENVTLCADIMADHCVLLALYRDDSMYGPLTSDLLFWRLGDAQPTEVSLWNTAAAPARPWEDYRALGWEIHNCVTLISEGYEYDSGFSPY